MAIATMDHWRRGRAYATGGSSLDLDRGRRGSLGYPLVRGGARTITIVGSGGFSTGGTADVQALVDLSMEGGLSTGGSALVAMLVELFSEGGLSAGGSAEAQAQVVIVGTGGFSAGGAGVVAVVPLDPGPGTLREAVVFRLKKSAALVEVLGSTARITTGHVSQTSGFPAVTISITSDSPGHHLGGADGTTAADVRIDVWAASQTTCDQAVEAVRRRFDGFRGRVGRVEVLSCSLGQVGDLPEAPPTGKGAWTYRSIMDFSIRVRVAIPDELMED